MLLNRRFGHYRLSGRYFVPGLAESFLFGVCFGFIYVPVYNVLNRRWGRD